MAFVGQAFIKVNAVTNGFNQDIRKSLNSADREALKVYDTINSLITRSYYLASGVTAASGAIGVLASGIFALGSQIAAATPTLIVLPSVFTAMAAAAITAKLALSGVGAAISKANKQNKAKANPAAGYDKMPGLLQAAKSALERFQDAQKRTAKAQARLNEVYEEAKNRIEDLKFSAEGAAISEKRASIELAKARETLARAQDLPPNNRARQEAELAFQEADLSYRQAVDRNADIKKEVAEVTANGTRSTQEEILNSKEYKAAVEAESEAIKDQKKAKDALIIAEKNVKEGKSGGGGAAAAVEDPYADLFPSQKKFAKFIVDLKPKIDELKKAAADNLLPGLEIAIDNLATNLFPSLNRMFAITGKALADSAIDFSKIATEANNLKNLDKVAGTNADTVGKFGKVAGNLYSVFLSLLSAADPLIRRFTDWTVTLTEGWKATREAKNQSKELTTMFNNAGDVAAQLGRILKNVGGAFLDLGKAASGPGSGGQMIFDYLETATKKFREFARVGLESGSTEEYFRKVAESFNKLLHILGVVTGAILRTADDPGTAKLFDSLVVAADVLGKALTHLSEGGAGAAFGKFIEKMAVFIGHTTEAGSIRVFFAIINTALGALNTVLNNPIAKKILLIVAAVHGARLAFKTMAFVGGKMTKYLKGDFLNFKMNMFKLKIFKMKMVGHFQTMKYHAMSAMKTMKGGLTSVIAKMKTLSIMTKIQTAYQKVLNFVTKLFGKGNPTFLIIAGIVALVAALILAYKKFEWFRNFVNAVFGGLRDIVMTVVNAIIGAFKFLYNVLIGNSIIPDIVNGIIFFFQKAYDFIKVIVDFIVAAFRIAWDVISTVINFAWNNIIKPIFEAFKTVFELAWAGIKLYFETAWAIVTGGIAIGWAAIKLIFEAFKTVFELAWAGIKTAFNTVWDIVKKGISAAWKDVIKPVFDAFYTTFKTAWDNIKIAFDLVWGAITKVIGTAKDVFGAIGTAIIDSFKAAINFIIAAWNAIEFTVPRVKVPGTNKTLFPGFTVGLPDIPPLALGGIVPATPGGVLARIGEGGRAERVEPLDATGLSRRDRAIITMLAGGQGGINITVNPSPGMDEVELASLVSRQLALQLRRGAA